MKIESDGFLHKDHEDSTARKARACRTSKAGPGVSVIIIIQGMKTTNDIKAVNDSYFACSSLWGGGEDRSQKNSPLGPGHEWNGEIHARIVFSPDCLLCPPLKDNSKRILEKRQHTFMQYLDRLDAGL
jgi:hypothetical protein